MRKEKAVFSDSAAIFSMTNEVHGFVVARPNQNLSNVQFVSGTYFSTLRVRRSWAAR